MRKVHEDDAGPAYTSEGGYTLQAFSDNDEQCGHIRSHDLPELLTDDSGDESEDEFEDSAKVRAREMTRRHSGLFGTCEEWPAEEFFNEKDMDKLAKEVANHILWQQDTTEVEEFLFTVGDRNVLTPRDTKSKQRNVYLRRPNTATSRQEDNFCLTAYMEINGHQAFTLFDLG
jgi:hypothetical protein